MSLRSSGRSTPAGNIFTLQPPKTRSRRQRKGGQGSPQCVFTSCRIPMQLIVPNNRVALHPVTVYPPDLIFQASSIPKCGGISLEVPVDSSGGRNRTIHPPPSSQSQSLRRTMTVPTGTTRRKTPVRMVPDLLAVQAPASQQHRNLPSLNR